MSGFGFADLKMNNLINKIFRFMDRTEQTKIQNIIIYNNSSIKDKLLNISKFVTDYVIRKGINKDDNRQDFIIVKINAYLSAKYPHLIQTDCKIIDIGGGNGNVLSGLKDKINGKNEIKDLNESKNNFICVETLTNWGEHYDFDNTNIIYKFFGTDFNFELPDNSIDIIMCMVSLHHMTNETITTIMQHIHRILKPNGIVLIKEHDANNESIKYIYWEHHLYHALDCAFEFETINVENYFNNFIYNFKSKEQWTNCFNQFGFELVEIKNRFLDGKYILDPKVPTNLYWAVYKKN